MRDVRKIFGWLFGMVAIVCVVASVVSFRDELFRNHGVIHLGAFVGSSALLLFAVIYGLACWNSWKETAAERGWGLGASLVNISVPILTLHLSRRRLASVDVETIVIGVLAFVAYVWPERNEEASGEYADLSAQENFIEIGDHAPRPEPQTGKHGVLRAYLVIALMVVVLLALLRATNLSWTIISALCVLAWVAALFGNQLLGPAEHIRISSPKFERRIQNRYRFESNQLSNLGFSSLFAYGEGFSLFRILLIYPAFVLILMWLNREVASMQNGAKLFFGFPVFNSGNGTTYAHPSQLGIKFHTRFQDGSILMTKSFSGKSKYGPNVIVHRTRNASIIDTWAEHQRQIQALEASGKEIDREITFEAFSDIQREA